MSFILLCVCVHARLYMHVCMHVFACVCLCVFMCMHVLDVCTCMFTYACACLFLPMCIMYVCTCISAHVHLRITCMCTCICVCMCRSQDNVGCFLHSFLHGFCGSTSSSHTYVASTFSSEPSPHPHLIFKKATL